MAFPNALMVEQPDSPIVREDGAYLRVTRRYKVSGRFTRTQLQQNEYIPTYGYVDPETGAEYRSYDYSSEVGYPLLEVEFEARLPIDSEYDEHIYTFERSIESHPSFLMKWRYELYSDDVTLAVPAWWNTATDKSDTEESTSWAWSKTGTPSGFDWLMKKAIKPGVTSYLEKSATVTKRKVYTDANDAFVAWGSASGSLLTPAVTPGGLSRDQQNWLIRDVRTTEDRKSWAMTVEFLYSLGDGWDTDIYSNSAITADDP